MQHPQSVQEFTPLPLRPRGVLEVLDTAVKVYKQYFWVLLRLSLIIGLADAALTLTSCGVCSPVVIFTLPILYGASACCLAAAVRGQSITSQQCWQFAQARLGSVLGWFCVALILASVVSGLLSVPISWLAGAATLYLSPFTGWATTFLIWLVLLPAISVVSTVPFVWAMIVPPVVCLEDKTGESRTLVRSYQLIKRHWVRGTALLTILSLGFGAMAAAITAGAFLLAGVDTAVNSLSGLGDTQNGIVAVLIALVGLLTLFTVFLPLFATAFSVFYLDIRTREEALDLAWTTYATAPPVPQQQMPGYAPPGYAPPGYAPPGYAPPMQPTVPVQTAGQMPAVDAFAAPTIASAAAAPTTAPSATASSAAWDAFLSASLAPAADPFEALAKNETRAEPAPTTISAPPETPATPEPTETKNASDGASLPRW